ncbi:membrane protein [Streptomyces sp. F-3]|uniref:MHYT domain-containing protein n=1 Tax=Streptomyces thermogriseus TaxID=75292 RepID=A0ABN1SSB4_9ACTN|nr:MULTISPECIES: MHYT domain-containing protein [Streptomyces]GAT80479.1 membrane protein [Streptomyces sp. F-3]
MHGTVDGFSYGLVTPVVACLMACLGGALGLHCTTRALLVAGSWRPGWLALASAATGSGIWSMHFVAMIGFTVEEAPVHYDRATTYASLAAAVVMVGVGIFIVGYRGTTGSALFTGGTITGLGIATMHYLGMVAMRLNGTLEYDTLVVAASVVVAVVAATAALWAAGQDRGPLWSVGGSLAMGLAASGMHYTGMAAVSVRLHGTGGTPAAGESPAALLVPMLAGPLSFLLLAGAVVLFDHRMVTGGAARIPAERKPGVPAGELVSHTARRPPSRIRRAPARAPRRGPVRARFRTPQNR